MTGKELKELREKADLKQEELGALVGMHKNTIYGYEKSENVPIKKAPILENALKEAITKKGLQEDVNTLIVQDPREIFNTKAGSNYEEMSNGKYLLTVPMVPFRAQATYISEFTDAEYISDLRQVSFVVDRVGKGKYMAFEVQNDSMNDGTIDSIPDGAIVLGRELGRQHWTNKLNTNVYPFWIIVHKDTVLCKGISKHDVEKGILTCHSLNNSPEYPDFNIKLNDVRQIFNIIKKQL